MALFSFFFKVTFCCTPPICFRFKYLKNKKTGGEHVLKDGPRQSISGSDSSCVRCVTQQLFTLSRLIFLHLSKHSRKKKNNGAKLKENILNVYFFLITRMRATLKKIYIAVKYLYFWRWKRKNESRLSPVTLWLYGCRRIYISLCM